MPALTRDQLTEFAADGYLVVDHVISPSRIAAVIREFGEVLDRLADELFADGRISSTYEDLPFEERLIEICSESGQVFSQRFDISLPLSGITSSTPFHSGQAMFDLLTDPNLLDVVESVIGPEIFSCPVQHARTKLPARALAGARVGDGLVGTAPWHQDNGVLLPEADQSKILTVWIPLNEATLENGCMRVLPRSHSLGRLFEHCPGGPGGLSIPEKSLPAGEPVDLPMRPGSVLLMTQSTVHRSLENRTEADVRMSLDLRYQRVGEPTGRPTFEPAGFVARSSASPETVLDNADGWREKWIAVRDALAEDTDPTFDRWDSGSPLCA